MSGIVRQAHDGPLCPMSMGPGKSTWHAAETLFADRLYNALKPFMVNEAGEPDADNGELPPELDKVYSDVTNSDTYKQMILHSEQTSFVQGRAIVLVESYFWRCHLCGHILPATTVSRKQ